jgi:hypothetical protein
VCGFGYKTYEQANILLFRERFMSEEPMPKCCNTCREAWAFRKIRWFETELLEVEHKVKELERLRALGLFPAPETQMRVEREAQEVRDKIVAEQLRVREQLEAARVRDAATAFHGAGAN